MLSLRVCLEIFFLTALKYNHRAWLTVILFLFSIRNMEQIETYLNCYEDLSSKDMNSCQLFGCHFHDLAFSINERGEVINPKVHFHSTIVRDELNYRQIGTD